MYNTQIANHKQITIPNFKITNIDDKKRSFGHCPLQFAELRGLSPGNSFRISRDNFGNCILFVPNVVFLGHRKLYRPLVFISRGLFALWQSNFTGSPKEIESILKATIFLR